MSVVHESQNYIRHYWQVVRIIKTICKFKVWFPDTVKVQWWAVDIHPDFIPSFHTFIIRNRCHFHRFYIQPIIHMLKHIMDIICYRCQLAMNFTKTFTRYAKNSVFLEIILIFFKMNVIWRRLSFRFFPRFTSQMWLYQMFWHTQCHRCRREDQFLNRR